MEKDSEVDNDAVGDDWGNARGQDARWQQVKRVLFVADDDGVARVVSAVELDYVVDVLGEQVGCFALALIAPLCTNNHYCRHG